MSGQLFLLIEATFATWCLTYMSDPGASRRERAAFAFGAVWFIVLAVVTYVGDGGE